jgi:hypothetical protein
VVGVGCAFALPRSETQFPSDSGQYGASLRWFLENLGGTELGFYYLNYHSRLPVVSGTTIEKVPPGFTNSYWTEYPEDIHLFGVSFNSNIGTWSLSGEVSYRPNLPLQFDDVEVLFAGLTPLNPLLPSYGHLQYKSQVGEFATWASTSRAGTSTNPGRRRPPRPSCSGRPTRSRRTRSLSSPRSGSTTWRTCRTRITCGTNGRARHPGGGPGLDLTGDWNNPETEPDGFADDFSWGYRLATRFDYNNAIGAWTMSPRLGWAHDVSGTTPGPGGSFVDGQKQLTLGLGFSYLNRWVIDLAYTTYRGAGTYNQLKNRDFVGASVSYSF